MIFFLTWEKELKDEIKAKKELVEDSELVILYMRSLGLLVDLCRCQQQRNVYACSFQITGIARVTQSSQENEKVN